nr:MAG TPA: hypothetical protein [Caudoviricetes sp.]
MIAHRTCENPEPRQQHNIVESRNINRSPEGL